MNLLATGHMLADVVAIMGKFFPRRPHYIFLLMSRLFSPPVGNHRILSFAIPKVAISQSVAVSKGPCALPRNLKTEVSL